MAPSPFLTQVRSEIRLRECSIKTEKSYVYWIKRFIFYYHKRRPREMHAAEVKSFLSWLASSENVAVNTHKVALNALAFLFHRVLDRPLGELNFKLATKQRSLPTLLTPVEVSRILEHLSGRNKSLVQLLDGSGLRISESLSLRIQDIDLEQLSLTIRDGKGHKDRQTRLSPVFVPVLQTTLEHAMRVQSDDNCSGIGPSLPTALRRKYPGAYRDPAWMFVFPSNSTCFYPGTNQICRHHLHASVLSKAGVRTKSWTTLQLTTALRTCSHLPLLLLWLQVLERYAYDAVIPPFLVGFRIRPQAAMANLC